MPGVAITMDIWSSGHGSIHQQAAMNSISTSSIPPGLDPDPLQLSTTSPAMCQPAFPGTLSLHHYRKQLSDGDAFAFDSPEGHILKRKNAAIHLNQTPMYPHHSAHPFSVSSAASSPPPLSPSYSPSAMSEQGPESLRGFALSPNVELHSSDSPIYSRSNPHRLLDTFRDRLEKYPDSNPDQEGSFHKHTRTRSDSILFNMKNRTATVIDHGTSFEIVNPHESLNFARIVSFIEDVDAYSARDSTGHHRESYIETTEERLTISEEDYLRAIAPLSPAPEENEQKVHEELVGDTPHQPIPSISERLQHKDSEDMESRYSRSPNYTQRRPPPLRPRAWTDESDLGEPGSPIHEDGDYPSPMSYARPSTAPFPSDGQMYPASPVSPLAGYYDMNLWQGGSPIQDGPGIPHPLYSNPPSPYASPSPFPSPHQTQKIHIHHNISKRSLEKRKKNNKANAGPLNPFKRLYSMFRKKRQ
ncbi:oxidoreductase, short-chain dehydrogenase/reductase family [Aspergillus vadensis CBS 113365]|uniref:Uncharacterized protein n=1 Tax=Aspergillus vadensis (strain CBS 113365 / IMI 142717 / IBT 24658) TaxID=1448311 RepID=A0A319C5E8_ASPVC|nr:hypothetical protein BO88DRAFT_252019 [Aspergillus vadensis CBS 113365]PYH70658.1 hypothetical protein BO88DRAFT_252019 [Aspergillus vadensis CBS 113365]